MIKKCLILYINCIFKNVSFILYFFNKDFLLRVEYFYLKNFTLPIWIMIIQDVLDKTKSVKLLLSVKRGMKIFSSSSPGYNSIGIVLFI